MLVAVLLSLIGFLFGVGHVSCMGATDKVAEQTGEAVLDRDFKIHYGQELTLQGQDLKIKFASLLDDSRCPANVKCVWEGDVKLLISVRQGNAEDSLLELHTNRRFTQEGKYQHYVIRLVAVDPHPRTNFKNKQNDYIATLRITKI